jgi:hypothetical protein
MIAPPVVHAQNNEETVTVKKSQLTQEQLSNIELQATKDKVEQYGKWVGIGHELGTAVNESLSAVTANANNFAQTGVGKWTIFLVVWKVAGHDLLGFVIGFGTLVVGFIVWCYVFYKNCIPHRILIENSKTTGKKWELVNQNSDREIAEVRWAHIGVLLIFGVICMITAFC